MVREGDTIIVSLDALRPAEVIELSSDPESDYDDYLRDGDRNNGAARATAGLSTPAKRKAEDQQGAAESLGDEGETPTSKRQRLPMRVKDTGVKGGHRRVEIEIPIPARRPKQPASQPAKEEDAEEHTTGEPAATEPASRKGHIHFDDDGRADQFFTPLEAPAQNPLETAHADASGSDSDSDAPPEAVSTSAAAAQTQQSARRAQRAAGEYAPAPAPASRGANTVSSDKRRGRSAGAVSATRSSRRRRRRARRRRCCRRSYWNRTPRTRTERSGGRRRSAPPRSPSAPPSAGSTARRARLPSGAWAPPCSGPWRRTRTSTSRPARAGTRWRRRGSCCGAGGRWCGRGRGSLCQSGRGRRWRTPGRGVGGVRVLRGLGSSIRRLWAETNAVPCMAAAPYELGGIPSRMSTTRGVAAVASRCPSRVRGGP